MQGLTQAQSNVLMTLQGPRLDRTYEILVEKGYFHQDGYMRITDQGIQELKTYLHKIQQPMREEYYGTPLLKSDEELFPYMHLPEVDIYVYRGYQPLVVRAGNGQKPLAILDLFYKWQIERQKSAGHFLKRTAIMGHKGSYGYELDPSYARNKDAA